MVRIIYVKKAYSVKECVISSIFGSIPFTLEYENDTLVRAEIFTGEEFDESLVLTAKQLIVVGEIFNSIENFGEIAPILEEIRNRVLPIAEHTKINAIKEFRSITGMGLKEAKDMFGVVTMAINQLEVLKRQLKSFQDSAVALQGKVVDSYTKRQWKEIDSEVNTLQRLVAVFEQRKVIC